MYLNSGQAFVLLGLALGTLASKWPYDRYQGVPQHDGKFVADPASPEFDTRPRNEFAHWLSKVVEADKTGELSGVFKNGMLPPNATFDKIYTAIDIPEPPENLTGPIQRPRLPVPHWTKTANLFKHLGYPVDPNCLSDDFKWYYRTYDGSCNWLQQGETNEGTFGQPHARDYGQHYYADGIASPRQGPNPRAVSNAFFKRNQSLYYEHTPFLLGLVEFIMHDVTYSMDSQTEFIEVAMPEDEDYFPLNTTMKVWRTEKAAGTGTSKENPREPINRATSWLDASALYGSSMSVARKLRSYKTGKLLTTEVQAPGTTKLASYLPFNTMDVPTRTRPGVNVTDLFAGGDPRTNEDWIMLGVHTLLLREHNRLCDILAKQHPEYDDERLYQTVRLLMSSKVSLIGNAYQMAYWTSSMPWPRDDGMPLYREMYGKNYLQINPINTYPWPLVTKNGKPMTISAEMAIVYRFHEFIIKSFPIKNALNETIRDQDLFDTGFDARGFMSTGLENILRGVASTHIPNFKSGVDEAFRSAGKYRGAPFDIVTWSLVHEREQGLPTFNQYFRAYNKQDPHVVVPIRKRFEDFTTNPEHLASLKRLYSHPDEVDLVVGCQLEEEMFPDTTIPKSSLIISLFSLFGAGNSDRFSVGFASMRCFLVDKPWDCHPSNALEDLLWKPMPKEGFPNFRFYDTFWLKELDLPAQGTNLLWRLVTENTEIKCLQKDPLFPVDEKTNPVMCSLPPQKVNIRNTVTSFLEIFLALIRQQKTQILACLALLAPLIGMAKFQHDRRFPPTVKGLPIFGEALAFQKNAKKVLLRGFKKAGSSVSQVFGLKLGRLENYVLSRPEDLQMMLDDNPYEIKFSASQLNETIGVPAILGEENFKAGIQIALIRNNLTSAKDVQEFGKTMEYAARRFLKERPLVPAGEPSHVRKELSGWCDEYVTNVSACCALGPEALDHPELFPMFSDLLDTADKVMGLNVLLPKFFSFIPHLMMNKAYRQIRKTLVPIIRRRRLEPNNSTNGLVNFLPIVTEIIDDDDRASDILASITWFGLRNFRSVVTSTLLDINNVPALQSKVHESLRDATLENLHTFGVDPGKGTPWALLRSCMFESFRLVGTPTGPARIVSGPHPVSLASDDGATQLPPKQIAALSSYYTHRQTSNYGPDAAEYVPTRFLEHDPDIGSPSFILWGLRGPHLCPARWFAQEGVMIMVKAVLDRYEFRQATIQPMDQRYNYHGGVVGRNEVEVTILKRQFDPLIQ